MHLHGCSLLDGTAVFDGAVDATAVRCAASAPNPRPPPPTPTPSEGTLSESLDTLLDLFSRTEFLTGLACGGVALLLIAVLPRSWRNSLSGAGWGVASALAILVGVQRIGEQSSGLLIGLALMAMGGALSSRQSPVVARAAGWALIIGGASLIPSRGQVDQDSWFYVATPVAAVLVGTGLAHWRTDEQRWIGALFAISAFGVWTTVPDTELARLMLGVAIPLSLATLPPLSGRVARAGAFALGGVFAWIPALGGEERPASIIGAWAAIGVIAILPAARVAWRARILLKPWHLFGVHIVVVVVAARVIGLWTWAVPALLAAIVMYVAAMFALFELDPTKAAPVIVADDR